MRFRDSLPEINRLAIVAAAIMLAFGLTQLISFPAQKFSFTFLGIIIAFFLDFSIIITLLTAVLAAAGMDWLIHSHHKLDEYQSHWTYLRHWIIPVLTTFVIGVVLNTFAGSPLWWVSFVLGSLLLMAVFVAEYNVVAVDEVQHPLARVVLISLSFALYLLLTIALFSANIRLYIRLPILAVGAMMVISRSLHLRLARWYPLWGIVCSLIVSQVAVGFHYLPLSPTQFGLLLVGLAYALTSFVTGIMESRVGMAIWMEPVVMFAIMVIVSFLWG